MTSQTYPETLLRNGQNEGSAKAIERASGTGRYNKGHRLVHEKTGQSHSKALYRMMTTCTAVSGRGRRHRSRIK
jgi:hypothetical protein